jgi:hypothetical protein
LKKTSLEIGKMQAVREKLHDMNVMRKAKAEAKAEEQVRRTDSAGGCWQEITLMLN